MFSYAYAGLFLLYYSMTAGCLHRKSDWECVLHGRVFVAFLPLIFLKSNKVKLLFQGLINNLFHGDLIYAAFFFC